MHEDRFSCVRAFAEQVILEASMHKITSLELLRTLCCVSATKQMKRLQGHRCWKASFSVRESCLMHFKKSSSPWNMFLSHEMKCYLQCRRQIFMC